MAEQQLALRLEADDSPIARRLRALGRRAQRAADKVTGKKPMEGFVDRVLAGEIQGWAFDPNKPNRRVHITAHHEGQIIAETLADLPRKDLSRGGKGDGKHGFNLRIPAAYLDGSPRRLRIEATSGRSRVLLRRGEITLASNRPGAHPRRPKPTPGGGPAGALEGLTDGLLTGWAAQPKSGGAPAVVDIYDDERYLGSVTADRPRPRREDEPRGAKTFQFRLPEGLDASAADRLRARITGAQVDLKAYRTKAPAAAGAIRPAAAGGHAPRVEIVAPEKRVALLVLGSENEDLLRRTMRSWSEQAWPHLAIGRVSANAGSSGQNVFGPQDSERLLRFAAEAHTLAVVRTGETLQPEAARILALASPLSQVLTWTVEGPISRRSEAWSLAIQLGDELGGGYAIRTGGLGRKADDLTAAALHGERALELALAGASLRWAHLPAVLSSRNGGQGPTRHAAVPPPTSPRDITLAVWGGWSETAPTTLRGLFAAASGINLEVLVPATAPDSLQGEIRQAGERISLRKVDIPDGVGAGVWCKRLSEAAGSEVVALCRGGLQFEPSADLAGAAGWALSPWVGAVTGVIGSGDTASAGLAIESSQSGWRLAPAAPQGDAPVLAAAAALMLVARSKLAAAGGFDAERFPADGADLDLCLRLRRLGWFSMVLEGLAGAPSAWPVEEASCALALVDPAELAAAAAAYPAARLVRAI